MSSLSHLVSCYIVLTLVMSSDKGKNKGKRSSQCALNALAIDEPLEYARLALEGNLQMWVDAEDSLEVW